jgi:8-hydroxy-5-deazaflavin:NADPH oxidoreductase
MFSSVGIIGSGAVGQAVARRCLAAGIPVVLSNSRGPASLGGIVSELGEAAAAGTVRRAADAELVVLAVPFVTVPDVGEQVDDWSGRVVVDATNHFAQYQPSYAGRVDLGTETGSEWVARQLPGATIIKAFNAMFAIYIEADPHHHDGRQVVFYAGDNHRANTAFASFAHTLGFAPVYVGGLPDGGKLIQLDGPLNGLHAVKQD